MHNVSVGRSALHDPPRPVVLTWLVSLSCALAFFGCQHVADHPTQPADSSAVEIPTTAEDLLIGAVDEVTSISEMPIGSRIAGSAQAISVLPTGTADSVYVYGALTPEGLGAVVTERHTYPKGLLLITVRMSFGRNGAVVSDTKQYTTQENFRSHVPDQSVTTEVLPLSRDTILTHVMRSSQLETYTFRLPVVSSVVNQQTHTTRVTSRFPRSGSIVSEVTDQTGALIRRTISTALPGGALETRTENPDGSWRTVTTLGRADGSILRQTTTGKN